MFNIHYDCILKKMDFNFNTIEIFFFIFIGEVKNRDKKPFSVEEAEEFLQKVETLREIEQVEKYVVFVFSRSGFTADALNFFQTNKIAWSDDERWLG